MIWVEMCCGAAAVTLRLLGGHRLQPIVSWMGGKRRYASIILAAMGVDPLDPVERVVLVDAGPWGWVWRAILDEGPAVAAVLDSWEGRDPRTLWDELRNKPPAQGPEGVAGWLWLQARSASGVPVWWSGWREAPETGWRMGEEPSKARRGSRTIAQTGGGHVAEGWQSSANGGAAYQKASPVARWEAPSGRGDLQLPGCKDSRLDPRWEQPDHATGRTCDACQTADPGGEATEAPAQVSMGWEQASGEGRPPQPMGQRNPRTAGGGHPPAHHR